MFSLLQPVLVQTVCIKKYYNYVLVTKFNDDE